MFKKTFLAVSVGAALVSAGAQATPTFDYAQAQWTNQAQEGVTDFAVPDVTFTLGTEYTDNDTVTITWSADVDGDYSTQLNGTPAFAENFADMKLGLLSSTSNSVTYRVVTLVAAQQLDAGVAGGGAANGVPVYGAGSTCDGVAIGDDCPLVTTGTAFTLTDDGVTDLTVANAGDGSGLEGTFAAVAQGGASLDGTETPVALLDENAGGAADDTVNLFNFVDQYAGAAGTALNGEIEVDGGAVNKTEFIGGTDDVLVVNFTEANTTGHHALTSGVTVTLSGDFSWIYDTNAVTANVQAAAGVVDASDLTNQTTKTVTVTPTAITVAYAYTGADNNNDLDVTEGVTITLDNAPNVDGNGDPIELEDTAFSVSTVVEYQAIDADYTDADTSSVAANGDTYTDDNAADLAAIAGVGGAWTYNGSVVDVYAMPTSFAKNLPFIWITNSGADTGEVFAVATTEDGTEVDMGEIGTIGATEIKSFSTAVQEAITAEGITTGRVTLELTTSVPACDINVSAQYYNIASMDRAALETSQTIGNVYSTDDASRDANRCNL